MFEMMLSNKFLEQELDFKTTYQARASTKEITVYCQLKDSECSSGLLMVRTVAVTRNDWLYFVQKALYKVR